MTYINVLIIIWTIFAGILSYPLYRCLFNPCFLMNLIWCISTSFASFGAFSFYRPSLNTYLYVFIFLIVFSISSLGFNLLITNIYHQRSSHNTSSDFDANLACEGSFEINIKLLVVIFSLLVIFLFPTLFKSINLILAGDIKALRAQYLLTLEDYMGRFTTYLYNYVIRPFFVFLNILAAYVIGKNQKQKWRILLLAIFGSSVHLLLSGGRMLIFEFLCYILIAMLLYKPRVSDVSFRIVIGRLHINISKRIKILLLILMPILVIIALVTSSRLTYGIGIIETFWLYLIGPMTYLDLIVNHPLMFGITPNKLLFGKATFGFITGIINTLISALGGLDYRGADYLANLYIEKFYNVSPTAKLNASATILYPFLRDWGLAGLIIGPFIIAFLVEMVYYQARAKKSSIPWNLALIAMYYMIIFSVWRYTLLYPVSYMAFFWILAFPAINKIKFRTGVKPSFRSNL